MLQFSTFENVHVKYTPSFLSFQISKYATDVNYEQDMSSVSGTGSDCDSVKILSTLRLQGAGNNVSFNI